MILQCDRCAVACFTKHVYVFRCVGVYVFCRGWQTCPAFFQFMSSLSYSGVYFVLIVSLQFDLSHALYAYYGTMFHIVSEIYERQIEPLSFSHLWTGLHGFWALFLFVDRSLPL